MSPEAKSYEFTQLIQAMPDQVFFAFTNATMLKEWMCDTATLSPKVGGRLYLAWNSGFYASRELTVFEPDRLLALTWFGRNEPAPTTVEVLIHPQGNRTEVKISHLGLGTGEAWEGMVKEVQDGWGTSLENLASVLESGPDLRILLRPMLGINIGDFDDNVAAHLGVPVKEGLRLDGVLEGMGAYSAGLRKDDVIVSLDRQPITDYASLNKALSGHRAGDKVEVIFYHGAELKTEMMELSQRPVPEMPASVSTMAALIEERFAGIEAQLDELLEGVSEAEASYKPARDEWSVKEVLAHLIHGERDGLSYVPDLVDGQARWSDDWADNLSMRVEATLSIFPTLADLRLELKRLYAEAVALYRNIPPDFPQRRKGTWWGMSYFAAEPPYHELGHFDQMRACIALARA
jgi:uncharacterized protein YndB with AHSA1/START domain